MFMFVDVCMQLLVCVCVKWDVKLYYTIPYLCMTGECGDAVMCPSSRTVDILLLLQGSVVDRHASEKEKAKDLPTYKDKDFLGDRRVLCIGSEVRQKLLNVFQADTEVIAREPKKKHFYFCNNFGFCGKA